MKMEEEKWETGAEKDSKNEEGRRKDKKIN
jgi:hypothetical protein